jgi:PAS domain S-box-containing protein
MRNRIEPFQAFILQGTFLLVLYLFFSSTLFARGGERRPVRIGIFQNEPVVFQNEEGDAKGLYVDLLKVIADKESWEAQYVFDSWDGCLERLRTGDIDLLTSISYTEERDTYADFSHEVVWTLWGVVFTSPDSDIEDVPSMEGKKVAVLKGGINGINFIKLCNAFGVSCRISSMPSYDAVLRAVESGEADAAIVNSVFGTMHRAEYDVKQSSIVFSPINAYFAVPENKNNELAVIVDSYLRSWKQEKDSVYYQSLNRWLMPHSESMPLILRWLVAILSVCALGILFFLLWIRLLRRSVEARTTALQESETRFRRAITEAPFPIMLHAEDGEVLMISKVWTDLTGYSPSDISTIAKWTKRAYGEERQSARDYIDNLYMISGRVAEGEWAIITSTGKILEWSFSSASLGALPDGRRLVISMAMDVTKRKRAEEELEKHREHLEDLVHERTTEIARLNTEQRLILDSVRVTIWYKDTKNNILRVNKAVADAVGLTVEDIEGKATAELFPDEAEEYYADDLEVIRSGQPKIGIVEPLRTSTGKELWVLTDKIPIKDDTGTVTGIIACAIDITERKQVEDALEKRDKELRTIINTMAGRENRMAELKGAIKTLRIQLEEAGMTPVADDSMEDENETST